MDGSLLSRRALERGITKHLDGQITVLYVIDPMLAVDEAEASGLLAPNPLHDRTTERTVETTEVIASGGDIETDEWGLLTTAAARSTVEQKPAAPSPV